MAPKAAPPKSTMKYGGKKGNEEIKVRPKAFRVMVHVIEVKDVKPETSDTLPDLVVTASVGSYGTKYTQVVRQATSGIFDTFLEWKFTATFEEFKNAKLTLSVLNANHTDGKAETLGMYILPLDQIRKQPMSEYFMTWLALYKDPDEYVTDLSGSMRATITCLGGAQQLPTHSDEEVEEARNDESPQVLMPQLVRWTHYSLFVAVYRIEGLPSMDDYGSTDAFVSVKLPGAAAVKTKIVRNSLNPSFNELLRLPVQLPIMYDSVTVSVSDYDQGGYDDLVADTSFSLNEIVRKGELQPHWIPLYGIKGSVGLQEIREKLPHVPLDTCYKGRLMLALMAEEVSDRLAPKVKSIGPCSDPAAEPFVLRFDLYQASQLDERSVPDNTQIQVELQVGGLTMCSSVGLADHGHVRWDEPFDEQRPMLPSDLTQCPDIFINVNFMTTSSESWERLGYIRLDLEDVRSPVSIAQETCSYGPSPPPWWFLLAPPCPFPALALALALRRSPTLAHPILTLLASPPRLPPSPTPLANLPCLPPLPPPLASAPCTIPSPPQVVGFNHATNWETLLRDPLYPQVSAVPGFLEYRLDFGKQSNLPRSARERITLPPMRKFELRAHIYQARNLPSMDEDGLANPYTVVTLQGFAGHTRVAEPTCNPMWYETVRVELQLPQPTPITSQILLRVYDMEAGDTVGGDQLIGRCYYPLLGVDKAFPTKPTWVPIWMDDPSDTRGELLCSFQLIAVEELARVPLNDITPPMRDTEVEVNVVGLRDILAYNNSPIMAPYVEIDAGDRSTAEKVRVTRTSSTPSGPDANFLETLVIHTRLPDDLLFCPSLNVRVFDYRGEGNTPVVGKAAIPLAPYCEWITEAEYVPNNRPRTPLYKISDEISEASSEEDEDVDHKHEQFKATISPNLTDANFSFQPEVHLDTPSAAELKLAQRKGRTGRGQRVRTLPTVPPQIPYGIAEVEPDEEAKIEKPLESELEHLIVDPPFDEWEVYRGLGVGVNARREVGRFKARLRVVEADLKSKALPRLDLADLFEQAVYITRVYITRGIKMASRDSDGLADPFLVLKNGRQKHNIIDDVKHVQLDTLNPNFYRCYELPTMIPGNPTLTIEVWDKDLKGASLIGATSIDVESRLLSQEWIEMHPKPVERRYLWSPASLAPQGKLEMWLEVLTPPQALATKPKVLRAPAALECQLRVVVWGVHELEIRGKSAAIDKAKAADVFVTVSAGHLQPQESDVHHGAVDYAEFNYRFLFDVQQPTRHSKLHVQVWDRHATGANDSLAECVLELRDLYKNVQLAQSRVHEVPRQFYALTHPLYPGQQGKADLSISMMNRPVAEALENIAGIGRGAPNQNPYLPPPDRSSQFAAARSRSSLGGLSLRRSVRDDRAGQSVAAAGGGGGELLVGGAGGAGGAEGGGGRGSTKEARKEARKEAKEARKEAKEARKEAAARKTEKRRSSVAGKRASTSAESDGANGSAAVGSGYSADEGEATDDQQSASAALAAGGAAPGVAGAPPPEVSKRPSLFRRLSRRRTSSGVELS